MTWVHRASDSAGVHVCAKPQVEKSDRIEEGDVWRCDTCLTQWQVGSIWRGDQREPLQGRYAQVAWDRLPVMPWASTHRCHQTPQPVMGHSFACPTGEHEGGWMHTMGGPHAGLCPAVEGQKCGPTS